MKMHHKVNILALICLLFTPFSIATEQKTYTSYAFSLIDSIKYAADAPHLDYVDPTAEKGGDVKLLASVVTFDSLNPFITKGTSAVGLELFYETLATSTTDEIATVYGLIAEKIEWPEDRSWVIFHINPKAKFHDQHPITAEDVVFSFNTLLEKGTPDYKYIYADVKNVKALDSHRVKFEFSNTENKELILTVSGLTVFPKHYWEDKDWGKSDLSIPVGSGPYTISKINPGKSITYSRIPSYWAADHFYNKFRYNFDSISYEYYRDRDVAFEAFKSGEFDFLYELKSANWITGYDFPAINKGLVKRAELKDETPKGTLGLFMNQRRQVFNNIALRQAMDYAFDFEWTNANIFHNLYRRVNSYFSNSELAATMPLTGRELEILLPFKDQLPASVFETPYTPPVTDGSGRNRENLRTAKKILDAAGYKIINNALIDPATNKPVAFELLSRDPSFLRIVNPYLKNLERLGIKVSVRQVDLSQWSNQIQTFDYDMVVLHTSPILSPGNEQYDYWHSSAADKEGSANWMGIKNPVIDKLIDLLVKAPSREELIYRTRALDRVLMSYHYTVPLHFSDTHRVAYWDKFKIPAKHAPYDYRLLLGIHSWSYDKSKAKKLETSGN